MISEFRLKLFLLLILAVTFILLLTDYIKSTEFKTGLHMTLPDSIKLSNQPNDAGMS